MESKCLGSKNLFTNSNNGKMYNRFCNYIIDNFFKEEFKGEPLSFLIDESVIQDFCNQNNCESSFFNKTIFNAFSRCKSSFENIIGIIAIQVYITSQRKSDDIFTAGAYNVRLLEFLSEGLSIGESTNYHIDRWYLENQDEYWKIFYCWCNDHDFYVKRIYQKAGPGRFVQYPLSFALFNKDDLTLFTHYFIVVCRLSPKEELSFEDFISIVFPISAKNCDFIGLKSRYEKIKQKQGESVERQVYNFYLKWNGFAPAIPMKSGTRRTIPERTKDFLTICIDETFDRVSIRNTQLVREIKIDTNSNLCKELSSYFDNRGVILFVKDPTFHDYLNKKTIEPKQEGLLLFNKSYFADWEITNYKHCCNISIIRETRSYILIRGKDSTIFREWYTKEIMPYELVGGLRLDRNIWMESAGPQIIFNRATIFLLNGKKQEALCSEIFSLQNYPANSYRLKIPDGPIREFHIQKPNVIISNCKTGWSLKRPNYWINDHTYDLKGLDFSSLSNNGTVLRPISTWVKLNSSLLFGNSISENEPLVNKQLKQIKKWNNRY